MFTLELAAWAGRDWSSSASGFGACERWSGNMTVGFLHVGRRSPGKWGLPVADPPGVPGFPRNPLGLAKKMEKVIKLKQEDSSVHKGNHGRHWCEQHLVYFESPELRNDNQASNIII
ncbi:hypothetical protein HanHA89_Chr16g0681531 [Helianthus annuus]|nr:hypothetical protein HanHA89_Chr16g0681531 [Helianthus annuus]